MSTPDVNKREFIVVRQEQRQQWALKLTGETLGVFETGKVLSREGA